MTNRKKTHRAIALHYDGIQPPKVQAKAYQERAQALVEAVREQGGLIHQDEQLSQWLNHLNVGEEIPEQLYRVIAELIAYAWFLDGKQPPNYDGINTKV
ncbi:hypothetical protein VST7929_01985 [Vibrio stylophorae]|uniref:Flagellar biosynthesis protein FlhB n=1 Tax=Vibrio stylophorae TaxID=659351 RepID=A0ABN8DSL7_9VIBR|nr:EscU/YscU/HrcU family type III secretion system export apparatus switch protein [Vibrio stylophorae]CAH0534084.1 hypothetical protein VST7929_01985 [Vibrio stylophorae]